MQPGAAVPGNPGWSQGSRQDPAHREHARQGTHTQMFKFIQINIFARYYECDFCEIMPSLEFLALSEKKSDSIEIKIKLLKSQFPRSILSGL